MRRAVVVLSLVSVLASLAAAGPASAGIWTPVASNTTQDITAVDYRAPDQLYYATSNGQIFKNGTLMTGAPGAGTTFTGIEFNPSGTIGLATANAGKLYRFNGTTWSQVLLTNRSWNQACSGSAAAPSTPTGNLTAVAWKDDTTAYVTSADRGVVMKTTNGGATTPDWTDVSRQSNGTCFVDPGSGDSITDVAVAGGDNVFFLSSYFGTRRFSSNGLTSAATNYGNTAVNCFAIPMHMAVDPNNPNRNLVVGDCNGSLSLGFSQDGGVNYPLGQNLPNGDQGQLVGLTDVAMAGGSWLVSGKGGTILVDSDGRNAYFQRADGALATTDWLATDKFDASHGVVAGRGGALAVSTSADTIPDLVAPAGTISGPTTAVAGRPATFTANVADNTGGSGINPASFAWSAVGVPGATGNPVSLTFPSAGVYTVQVAFSDVAGNAGSASLTVTVSAPVPVTPPKVVTKATTVAVSGGTVTLKSPKSCVPVGAKFTATMSFKRKTTSRTGKVIKIIRVVFYIDGKKKVTDKKAPFAQRLTVKSYKAGSTHRLKARATMKVRHGKPPTKSISTTFKVCG